MSEAQVVTAVEANANANANANAEAHVNPQVEANNNVNAQVKAQVEADNKAQADKAKGQGILNRELPEQDPGETEKQSEKQSEKETDRDPDDLPIEDVSTLDLQLPEGFDEELAKSFSELARDLGMTPRQARSLAAYQMQALTDVRERTTQQGIRELSQQWGRDYVANISEALALVSRIDRIQGCENFSKALEWTGAGCHADIIRGLYAMARMTAEDSVGKAHGPGTIEHVETPFEAMAGKFKV